MNSRKAGAAGETAALSIYIKHGYCLVAKNWHYSRFGEIDLVFSRSGVTDGKLYNFIVFCEVKLRKEKSLLMPAESVGITKQKRIRKLAEIFIEENPRFQDFDVRFDVAEVCRCDSGVYKVRILTDAF